MKVIGSVLTLLKRGKEMAKKAAKKDVAGAKGAKKTIKAEPVVKKATKSTPEKAMKQAKPSGKLTGASEKVKKDIKAEKSTTKEAKASSKPAKEAVKSPSTIEAKKTTEAGKKVAGKEDKKKIELAAKELPVETSKKEKKVKIDKTGMTEDQIKWHELHEKHRGVKPLNYSIAGQFEAKTPIQHKIFGWGFIMSNEYDRLEVLFQDGKRMLISNRKL